MRPDYEPNFRPTKAQRLKNKRARKRAKRARRPGNSLKHLENIRALGCIITGKTIGVQVHHLKCMGGRGGALTAPDRCGVPLHETPHLCGVELAGSRNDEMWFLERGIEPITLANELWAAQNDFGLMQKIWKEHRRLMPLKKAEYWNQFYG